MIYNQQFQWRGSFDQIQVQLLWPETTTYIMSMSIRRHSHVIIILFSDQLQLKVKEERIIERVMRVQARMVM